MSLSSLVGIYFTIITVIQAADWTYDQSDSDKGPAQWSSGDCSGNHNSPINIVKGNTEPMVKLDWNFVEWNVSKSYVVSGNGHTIKFTPDSSSITTSGGGLEATYKFVQFHFHWGATNTLGSEHTVDGTSYPLEMHLVHYKNSYATPSDALSASNDSSSLAALGFFFTLASENNSALTDLVSGVQAGQSASPVSVTLNALNELTAEALSGDYYRYMGGLTTPNCNEQVKWTVFATPIKISETQLATFRGVNTTSNMGTELYRPVQPLNGRTVYKYTEVLETTTVSLAITNEVYVLSTLLTTFIIKLFL